LTDSKQTALHEEINRKIEAALSLLMRYDPRDLISRVAMLHATNEVDNFEDSLHSNEIAQIEYAQSLALTDKLGLPREPAFGPVADEFARLIDGIFTLVIRFFSNEKLLAGNDDLPVDIRFTSMLSYLTMRGSPCEEHFSDLLRGLFGNHNSFLEGHYDLNIETVISSFRSLVEQINDKLPQNQTIVLEKASYIRLGSRTIATLARRLLTSLI
jgi:hypothetical protein